MERKQITALGLIVLLFIFGAFHFTSVATLHAEIERLKNENTELKNKNSELNAEIALLKRKIAEKDANIANLLAERNKFLKKLTTLENENRKLEEQILELTAEINTLRSEQSTLSEEKEKIKSELRETLEKISNYKNDLYYAMEWFKENSSIAGKNFGSLGGRLKYNCMKVRGNTCYINISCIWLVNYQLEKFRYESDINTASREDKLLSLEEFYSAKGGDCEDFSLFFKAEYNFLMEECKKSGTENIKAFAWREGSKTDRFWLNFQNTWYLKEARISYLDGDVNESYVICGNIFDVQQGSIKPHCIVAFWKFIKEPDELKGAYLVEPQTGKLLGKLGIDSEIYFPESGKESYIWLVISNYDVFVYNESTGKWFSNRFFLSELEKMEERIKKMLED